MRDPCHIHRQNVCGMINRTINRAIAAQEGGPVKVVYVAGPFRAPTPWEVESNIRVAEGVGLDVIRAGACAVIPHTMYRYFDKTITDGFALRASATMLSRCDAVMLCPRWRDSEGTLDEITEAKRIGIPVFEFMPDLRRWLG